MGEYSIDARCLDRYAEMNVWFGIPTRRFPRRRVHQSYVVLGGQPRVDRLEKAIFNDSSVDMLRTGKTHRADVRHETSSLRRPVARLGLEIPEPAAERENSVSKRVRSGGSIGSEFRQTERPIAIRRTDVLRRRRTTPAQHTAPVEDAPTSTRIVQRSGDCRRATRAMLTKPWQC